MLRGDDDPTLRPLEHSSRPEGREIVLLPTPRDPFIGEYHDRKRRYSGVARPT